VLIKLFLSLLVLLENNKLMTNFLVAIGAMGLTFPIASPFAVLGAMEATEALLPHDVKVDGETSDGIKLSSQRPISAWKSWEFADPS